MDIWTSSPVLRMQCVVLTELRAAMEVALEKTANHPGPQMEEKLA